MIESKAIEPQMRVLIVLSCIEGAGGQAPGADVGKNGEMAYR
jgi:hypothetical protein